MWIPTKKHQHFGKDKIFAYFVGIIGLSCIIYTYIHINVIRFGHPDILYVDKETLNIQKSGRYAVLSNNANKEEDIRLKDVRGKVYDTKEEPNDDAKKRQEDNQNLYPNNSYQLRGPVSANLSRVSGHASLTQVETAGASVIDTRHSVNVDTYTFLINQSDLTGIFKNERTVKGVSCQQLFDKDDNAIIDASLYMSRSQRKTTISNEEYRSLTVNCDQFKRTRGYFSTPFTELERDFPLAYSIIAYKDPEQVERLLRAIYRPQNFYCIHVDSKASVDDMTTINAISGCFPNVLMAKRSVDVQWGTFSVLEAELICMKELWMYTKWKYFINLTGQEFPLKTNLELVKILKAMQGANIVDGTWVRARKHYFARWTKSGKPPPHNIRPIKGSVHVVINREFVDFALHNYKAKDFLIWLNETDIPDESFFSSLNHNSQLKIPGSFLGDAEEYPKKPTFTRYKNWEEGHGVWVRQCSGKFVRNICILGIGDLHRLRDDIALFVNKFYLDYQYLAYECMEEYINRKTKDQYLNRRYIDVTFYEMLDQVKLRYVKTQ